MQTLSLFDFSRKTPLAPAPDVAKTMRPVSQIELRPYQVAATDAINAEFEEQRSTLLVMCTGSGKTTVFGSIANNWPGRVLVLAHRDELIQQAQKRLEAMTGEFVDVEQAGFWSSGARVVVGSVQTMGRPRRLERFKRDDFSLVIVDEAHHAPSETYRRIIKHFEAAKLLGVTATPDRQDRKALGQIFESVAFVYDIENGIGDGWLSPITMHQVTVDSIDLSNVGTVAGDLNQGDLNGVMATEENIHAVVRPCIELAKDRRTIVFTTSVEASHRMAEVFNRYRVGCAKAVDGSTDKDERRSILKGFERDDFQFLVNVGIATEGFDSPGVGCVAVARPTKSRALYTQMIGRGLRLHPGKTDCLVLDFKGNSGRHSLVSPIDILGGHWADDVVALAKDLAAEQGGMDPQSALKQAKAQIDERKQREEEAKRALEQARSKVKAKVNYQTKAIDPFSALGVRDPGEAWGDQFGWEPPSKKLHDALVNAGVDLPPNCSKQQAMRLMGTISARRKAGLSSFKQNKLIQKKQGIDFAQLRGLRFQLASQWVQEIIDHGWKPLPPERVHHYLNYVHTPGEEG